MNRIVTLLIAWSLLLTAAAPVAAVRDGTSNTRSSAVTGGCDTAGHHEPRVHAAKRDGRHVCVVPDGGFAAPPAR
jgi:hypothetical protein